MKNFKEIEYEINQHLSSINENHSEAMAMIKTAVERISETNKKIEELEKTRDNLIKELEAKNANK